MRAYDFATVDGTLEVVIFARTEDAAAVMFCDLHMARYGKMPDEFHSERRTLKAQRNPTALRAALRLRRSGLGTISEDMWSIEPIPSIDTPC